MFSIPAPYAPTPGMRNQIRLHDLRTRVLSAKNNLQLAVEQLDGLSQILEIADFSDESVVDLGRVYTTAEHVGRNLAEVTRLEARYAELALEITVLASSMEVTR